MNDVNRNIFLNSINIYEVNVRQYTKEGTFAAFAKHLPRLKDMGVRVLWIMPITPISVEARQGSLGSYYACSDYVSINPEFGNLDDFKNMVQQAHALDMKLIIDWVTNHTGYDHHWAKEHSDWYKKDASGNFIEEHGWKDVIDLNYDNADMRAEMIRCMQYWINECDIDGFRCDMAHLVRLEFWIEAKQQCETIKQLLWLAESEATEYYEVFDIMYAWNWMHTTERFAKGAASLHDLTSELQLYEDYPPGAFKLFFTSNHDENTWNGTEYEKYGDNAKAFAIISFTWSVVPLIYSGQELPNLKRLKFFDKDEIEWTNKEPALQNFYKRLTNIRTNNSALHFRGNIEVLHEDQENKVLVFLRTNNKDKVIVLLNLSSKDDVTFNITHPLLEGNFENVFSDVQQNIGKTQTFRLQPYECIILYSV